MVHGFGNIFLLWFHWVFALQYYRASKVLAICLLAPEPVEGEDIHNSIETLPEGEMTNLFMRIYNRDKARKDKKIQEINKRILITQLGGGPPMFGVFALLVWVFESDNAGNSISFVIGVAIAAIFARALQQI